MKRVPTKEEFCHERLGTKFVSGLSEYDTRRRVEVLVDDFLPDEMLRGKQVVDIGCGLGYFSKRLVERGAVVTATDLSPTLVAQTCERAGCEGHVADVMDLGAYFEPESVDGVVSSECIEHVPDPLHALRQIAKIVKPGGFISISTPNFVWYPVVRAATILKLRPFDGHENFSSWRMLRKTLEQSGATILREHGLHLFPFQLPGKSLLQWCDNHLQFLRGGMINICILAKKS